MSLDPQKSIEIQPMKYSLDWANPATRLSSADDRMKYSATDGHRFGLGAHVWRDSHMEMGDAKIG